MSDDALDIIAPVMERLDRLTRAVESLVALLKPSDLAAFNQEAHRTAPEQRAAQSGPLDPEPPAPTAPEVFKPFHPWECPVHHSSKHVPAGVSKNTGKPYKAFTSCAERDCRHVADWCRVPGCPDAPPAR